MTNKERSLVSWVLNVATATLWAANCIINTSLIVKIIAAVLCVLHGFLAGMLFAVWVDE